MQTLLAINTSPMTRTAVTRRLVEAFLSSWKIRFPGGRIIRRDLGVEPPPHPDERSLLAFSKPVEALTDADREALQVSDELVSELIAADHVVIGSPMYNFTVTSGFKAWIDMVARARLTFRYTENGPVGLLRGKRAFLVVASGGTAATSAIDFATGYLLHMLRFLGIEEIEIIAADRLKPKGENNAMADARRRIERLLPAPRSLAATA